jgi:hypothetical protein
MLSEPRLDTRDQRLELPVARGIFEPRSERLVRQARRAVNEIKAEREERKRRTDTEHRRFRSHAIRFGAIIGARLAVGGKQTPRNLDARGLGLFLADQSARAIALDLAKLIAIDGGIEGLRRTIGPRTCKRPQKDEEHNRRKAG